MEWLGSVPTTLVSDVLKTSLPSGQAVDAIFSERKVNSSCESCGKSGNFLAACSDQLPSDVSPCLVSPLLTPLCCWWCKYIPDHVSSFGSIQMCHYVGNKDTTGVYSLNVVMLVMCRKCTTTEPSSTFKSKVPGYSWWVVCARLMRRSGLTFPPVVSLCRIER